jgi:hypothetical protein
MIEDDTRLATMVGEYLASLATALPRPTVSGLAALQTSPPDLVTDLMLPTWTD